MKRRRHVPRIVAVWALTTLGACARGDASTTAPTAQSSPPRTQELPVATDVTPTHALPEIGADGSCPLGYRPYEDHCVDLDECAQVATPCGTRLAACANSVGGYTCACPPGYVGGGPTGLACSPRVVATGGGTCLMPEGGGVLCFGDAPRPLGTPPRLHVPPRVEGLDDVASVHGAESKHLCALRADGHVMCWGANSHGELGDGTNEFREGPVIVPGLADVVALDTGLGATCAIVRGGALYCWGLAAYFDPMRQAGARTNLPTRIPLEDVVQVSTSTHHCAVRRSGAVVCWGNDRQGQMGLGTATTTGVYNPGLTEVPGVRDVVQVDTGEGHTVAITANGRVLHWGVDSSAPLSEGSESADPYRRATFVRGIEDAIALGTETSSCVLTRHAGALCWRANIESSRRVVRNVPGTAGAVAMTCGMSHCCEIDARGLLACWGALGGTPIAAARFAETPETDARWQLVPRASDATRAAEVRR